MSGGVDSSVAASVFIEQGFDTIGVTFRMLPGSLEKSTTQAQPWQQAAMVCEQLKMKHLVVDCRDEFIEKVLKPAFSAYAGGRTPNPCVVCNPKVKFHQLLAVAHDNGSELMATGHHAKLIAGPRGAPMLCAGSDPGKDQSYFLYALLPEQLRALRLPIGEMTKAQVRARARELGLTNADQPDSQDACFSSKHENFAQSLCSLLHETCPKGFILNDEGRKVGVHDGVHLFTIGQRRGLGVALGKPAWVKSIDSKNATVIVTTQPADLLSSKLLAKNVVFTPAFSDFTSGPCQVKIRSTHKPTPAFVDRLDGHEATVSFLTPQRAVTPGQAVVFYDCEKVVGGGTIDQLL